MCMEILLTLADLAISVVLGIYEDTDEITGISIQLYFKFQIKVFLLQKLPIISSYSFDLFMGMSYPIFGGFGFIFLVDNPRFKRLCPTKEKEDNVTQREEDNTVVRAIRLLKSFRNFVSI
ncbi:hypothetical protein BDC45DRAFT_530015 [Circinella umbellata]|nr:hypothetical protein BDC45DRAFT_530015 [Circinella umbellata]